MTITLRKAAGLSVATALAITAMAIPALAEGQGIGGVSQTLTDQISGPVRLLIATAAFVLGLGVGASGLMKFKQHSENPQAVPLTQPLVRVIVGAMLIALPSVLGVGIGTFFEDATTTNASGDNSEEIDPI